jgi:hypothetical protein
MTPQELAAATLLLIAGVLRDAVERGQRFSIEQFAGTRSTGAVIGKDGRPWVTVDPSGAYKLVLTVEPLPSVQESTQATIGDTRTNWVPAPTST